MTTPSTIRTSNVSFRLGPNDDIEHFVSVRLPPSPLIVLTPSLPPPSPRPPTAQSCLSPTLSEYDESSRPPSPYVESDRPPTPYVDYLMPSPLKPHHGASRGDSQDTLTYSIWPARYTSSETLRPISPSTPEGYLKSDCVQHSSMAEIHDRDDIDFVHGWRRYVFLSTPIIAVVSLSLYWLYFILRIKCVISAMNKYHSTFPLAWVFIGIELTIAVPVFMNNIWSLFILKKRNRKKLRVIGNDVPSIDVFVTCCGEDDDLILDTVRAACDVDYPRYQFRVIVLDDGKSETLRKSVQQLTTSYPNVYYVARPKHSGVPHYFKAGNLNYGLDYVRGLPGGASQFMAGLDADMIPEKCWLRALVPHLMLDEKLAMACPPQLFYNVPQGDPLCQSLDYFVHVAEPIKDAMGVAWCTGSGYVMRRQALDEIGGFPQGSLAEDVATSTLMLGRGWKTAFVHEALQFGTVPEDYGSHLKQRTRWAIGTVDTTFKLNFCLWGKKISHMTFFQRLSGLTYGLLSLFNILISISIFAIPIVLIWNKPLVAYANDTQLRWLIRACFAAMMSNRLCEFVQTIPSGYHTGQRGGRYQLWMAPYIAVTIIRCFCLPTWLGGIRQAFSPTGSIKSDLHERNPKTRARIWRRFRVICLNYLALFHLSYVYFLLAAVVLSSYYCIQKVSVKQQLLCLLTHAFWPPLSWVLVISAFWIPITYACDPPSIPDRELLLERDEKTGVAHPTPKSKKIAFDGQTASFEVEYFVTTAYTALVFAASFFY